MGKPPLGTNRAKHLSYTTNLKKKNPIFSHISKLGLTDDKFLDILHCKFIW